MGVAEKENLAVSQEGINGTYWFFAADLNSGKLEVTLIIFSWSWSKMGVVFLVKGL